MKGSLRINCMDFHTSLPIFSLSTLAPGKLVAILFAERLFSVAMNPITFLRGLVNSEANRP